MGTRCECCRQLIEQGRWCTGCAGCAACVDGDFGACPNGAAGTGEPCRYAEDCDPSKSLHCFTSYCDTGTCTYAGQCMGFPSAEAYWAESQAAYTERRKLRLPVAVPENQ